MPVTKLKRSKLFSGSEKLLETLGQKPLMAWDDVN